MLEYNHQAMEFLKKFFNEFVYGDDGKIPKYRVYVGWFTATSLSGFITGVIVASIMWFAAYYIRYYL